MQGTDIGSVARGAREAAVAVEVATGRIVLWTPAASGIFGYPSEEALGSNAEMLVPPTLRAQYRDRVARYRETGQDPYVDSGVVLEVPALPKDGGEILVGLTLSALEEPPGETAHGGLVLALVRDVAGRPGTGRGAGEELHRLPENVADRAILLVDADGRIATWESGAEGVFGYRRDEIVGEEFSVLFEPEEARPPPGEELERASVEGRVEVERRLVREDGSVFPGRLEISPWVGPPGGRWYSVVLEDVSRRRALEERLALRAGLLDHVGDAVLAADERCVLTVWNRGAEEMYGWSAGEVLGRRIEEIGVYDLSDEQTLEALRGLCETGQSRAELLTYRRDGASVPTEDTAVVLRDGQGQTVGYLSINRDATRLRQAEEELRESQRHASRLRRINEVAPAVGAASTVEEVLRVVVEQAREVVGAHQAAAYFTSGGDLSRWTTATSLSDKYAAWREGGGLPPESGIQARVRQTNSPVRLTREELDAHPVYGRFGEPSDEHPPVRGVLAVPLTGRDGGNIGLIQLSDRYEGGFTETDESLLVRLARIASPALEQTLLYQQTRSAIDGLSAHVAVLDETGLILATNRAWREFAAANTPAGTPNLGEGANYLEVCELATGPGSEEARRTAEAIREIVSGERESFEVEYPCHSPEERRWFVESVKRLPDFEPPRLIVIHENVTERRKAQEETETRTRQQAAVAELGVRALAIGDPQALMEEAVLYVARTLEVEFCKIVELLPGGEELLLRAGVGWDERAVGTAAERAGTSSQAGYTLRSDGPVIVEDMDAEDRFEPSPLAREHDAVSGVTVVISGRDRPFGVLGAHTASRRDFSGDDVNFLQAVANVLATAVERHASESQRREVREAERSRLARDLHDEALQDLTSALAEARLIQEISQDPESDRRLHRLVEALTRAGRGTRSAIYDLRLEREAREHTLAEMLESIVEVNRRNAPDREIELSVEEVPNTRLPEAKRVALLRIIQEALLNALRHSETGPIRVTVGPRGGRLRAEVEDDGGGFDPSHTGGGMGIKGMRERAHAVGGQFEISSRPGEATRVSLELDLGEDRQSSGGPEEVRILLVEDHVSVRQATASMLDREPGFSIVGQAGSLSEARGMLGGVDVALVDLGLPDGYGGDLIRDLREASPGAQALVLSAMLDRAEIARAVESGAAGVLNKSSEMDEIMEAVRRLRAGETLMPLEEVVELLRFAGSQREEEYEARQAIAQLTARETEVLQALAEGLDSNQVAERLNISVKTETNHMTNILNKLGMHSRLQALVFAIRHGVVEVR